MRADARTPMREIDKSYTQTVQRQYEALVKRIRRDYYTSALPQPKVVSMYQTEVAERLASDTAFRGVTDYMQHAKEWILDVIYYRIHATVVDLEKWESVSSD